MKFSIFDNTIHFSSLKSNKIKGERTEQAGHQAAVPVRRLVGQRRQQRAHIEQQEGGKGVRQRDEHRQFRVVQQRFRAVSLLCLWSEMLSELPLYLESWKNLEFDNLGKET